MYTSSSERPAGEAGALARARLDSAGPWPGTPPYRRRLLVCDDEFLIRSWLEAHLGEAGYRVETVSDGTSMLSALERAAPDLVILDLRLPGESGIELLARIGQAHLGLPVIIITCSADPQEAMAALQAGACHVLEKSIGFPRLLSLIEQCLVGRWDGSSAL